MTIEAHFYPTNAAFPFSGSQGLLLDVHSSFNSQHHHPCSFKHQQRAMQHPHNQRQIDQNISASSFYNPSDKYGRTIQLVTPNSRHLPVQFDGQRDEVDHYIKSQNEKLRILLQEQRKQQTGELLEKVGSDALRVLSQKDAQIAQAAKRRAELEEFLRKLETENETWKRVARENEAMVLSLHNTLEQIKERASYGMLMEVAESCCDENRENMGMDQKGTEERGLLCGGEIGEAEEIAKRTMVCKSCNSRNACFMFLPCRHLCSCKICEPFLQACPVCKMPKKSSIETLVF